MSANGITCLQDAVEDCDGIIIGAISGNLRIADEDIPTDLDMLVTHCPPYGILDDGLGSPCDVDRRSMQMQVAFSERPFPVCRAQPENSCPASADG